KRRAAKLGMRRRLQVKTLDLLQDTPSPFQGIYPAPGSRAMRCLSFDSNVDVNSPLVPDRDFISGANADDGIFRRSFQIGRCAFDRIMSASLASRQKDEHQLTLKRPTSCRVRDCTQGRRERGLLFRDAAAAHSLTLCRIDQLPREGVSHACGGMSEWRRHQEEERP